MRQKYDFMTFTKDIGLYTINRPMFDHLDAHGNVTLTGSCKHRTQVCESQCYNNKFYKLYQTVRDADDKLAFMWENLDPDEIALNLFADDQTRFRLCSRGEPFRDHSDVVKVAQLLEAVDPVLVWAPTRAWRDPLLRLAVHDLAIRFDNFAPLASLDESNTPDEYEQLVLDGWPTMWFGPPTERDRIYGVNALFKCPKTYRKLRGHCAICKAGCFAPRIAGLNRRVDVDLGTAH